jgi:hypothetical protein
MSTSLQTSGSISLDNIRDYIGQGGTMNLSGITTPYSANQIFNSAVNTTTPSSNLLRLSDLYGKTFAIYNDYSRRFLYGTRFINFMDGYFRGYFGLGTPSSGTSGMLYTQNKGFPIFLSLTTGSYFNWRYLSIQGRIRGVWYDIGPLLGYSQTTWDVTGEYEEIQMEVLRIGLSIQIMLEAYPMADERTRGSGVHNMDITLEIFEEESSSSGLKLAY